MSSPKQRRQSDDTAKPVEDKGSSEDLKQSRSEQHVNDVVSKVRQALLRTEHEVDDSAARLVQTERQQEAAADMSNGSAVGTAQPGGNDDDVSGAGNTDAARHAVVGFRDGPSVSATAEKPENAPAVTQPEEAQEAETEPGASHDSPSMDAVHGSNDMVGQQRAHAGIRKRSRWGPLPSGEPSLGTPASPLPLHPPNPPPWAKVAPALGPALGHAEREGTPLPPPVPDGVPDATPDQAHADCRKRRGWDQALSGVASCMQPARGLLVQPAALHAFAEDAGLAEGQPALLHTAHKLKGSPVAGVCETPGHEAAVGQAGPVHMSTHLPQQAAGQLQHAGSSMSLCSLEAAERKGSDKLGPGRTVPASERGTLKKQLPGPSKVPAPAPSKCAISLAPALQNMCTVACSLARVVS